MRKINRYFFYVLFFSLLLPAALFSAETGVYIDASCRGTLIDLEIRLEKVPAAEILESLAKGYRSEIIFNVKLYRKTEGFFSFLGDRLVREANHSREAGWDMFDRVFYFIEQTGKKHIFQEEEQFFSELFSLKDFHIPADFDTGREYYLLANVQVDPVKLTPPISIIRLLRPEGRYTTSWKRVPVEPGKEGDG